MEIPRRINGYCPHCDGHHQLEVEKVRSGRQTGMKWGARQQERQEGIGNDGRFSKVPAGKKPSQKTNLKYRCSDCGKAHQRSGVRTRKLELKD